MNSANHRFIATKDGEELRARYSFRPRLVQGAVLLLILLGALLVTLGVVPRVIQNLRISSGSANTIVPLALSLALFSFDIWVLASVLLQFFGSQEIVLDREKLSLSTCIFGLRRSRTFSIGSATEVRIEERSYPTKKGVGTIRRIAFEVDGKSIVTRGNLSPSEAEELLALLVPYFSKSTVPAS